LSALDIVLALLLVLGAYHGYKAGFLLEFFSLLAIILGVLGGFKLMGIAIVYLADRFNVDQKLLPYIAFGVVFILIVIVVNLLGKVIKASVAKTFLGGIDAIVGGLLGLLKTAFMLSITFWIVDSMNFKILSEWAQSSWLYPMVANFAPGLTRWISELFPVFRDVF
jgi:membrane protein required for colicin V production